jgi:glycosyltransferase A (GT-A) superfamily protein (DUF2064 family)/molybdopterin-guanine dinucleotide biosynthesis protein A
VAERGPRAHRVAAVVPAWNEVVAIGQVVSGLRSAGACCVYVVDPGSGDGTQEAARAAGAEVVHEPCRGYGRACLSGAEAALAAEGHELIVFLDGDGSCNPSDLPRLIAAAQEADVVLGRRELAPGALPWHARAGNQLVAAVLRARSGRPVRDLPPFKAVRRDALELLHLDDTGYGWTAQLVGRALGHPALRVVEETVRFEPRLGGVSKVSGRLRPSLHAGRAMLERAWSARSRGALVLMAKAPVPGHSKTRLERDLDPAVAAGFWAACLRESGDRLRRAAGAAGVDALAMTPSAADADAVRWLTGLPALAQSEPGLGPALLEASELAAPFTIAVSADVPTLPVERLLQAVAALRAGRDVLGPGPDGGYYLVGLRRGVDRRRRRRAFLEAPLGGGQAFDHARAALGELEILEPWADVDTVDELDTLISQVRSDPELAPALTAWLRGYGDGHHAAGGEPAAATPPRQPQGR